MLSGPFFGGPSSSTSHLCSHVLLYNDEQVDCIDYDNFSIAKKRFISLYKRLSRDPDRLIIYDNIIKTQESDEVIESVDKSYLSLPNSRHYIPHRVVIREDRETTKMRIVYDASAKKFGPSLNDCLEIGPSLLPKLFNILIRFRSFRYGITSDIRSAFLNITIKDSDRNHLRFLWVDDVNKSDPEIVVPLVDNFVLKWRKTIAALISIDAMSIPRYYLENGYTADWYYLENACDTQQIGITWRMHVIHSRLDYTDLVTLV